MFVILRIENGDQSSPEGDGGRGNNSSDSQNSPRAITDWREVRANLFAREEVMYSFFLLRLVSFLFCLET